MDQNDIKKLEAKVVFFGLLSLRTLFVSDRVEYRRVCDRSAESLEREMQQIIDAYPDMVDLVECRDAAMEEVALADPQALKIITNLSLMIAQSTARRIKRETA